MNSLIKLCVVLIVSGLLPHKVWGQSVRITSTAGGVYISPLPKSAEIAPIPAVGVYTGIGVFLGDYNSSKVFHHLTLNYNYASVKRKLMDIPTSSKYHLGYLGYEFIPKKLAIGGYVPIYFGLNLGWGESLKQLHTESPLKTKESSFYWAPKIGVRLFVIDLALRYDNMGRYSGIGIEAKVPLTIAKF